MGQLTVAVTALAAVRATRRARRDGGTERRRSVQKLAESVAIGPSGRARRSRGSASTTTRRSRAPRAAAITGGFGPKPRCVLRRRGPRDDGKAPASRPGATTPRAAERQALPVEHDGARRQHALGRRRGPGGERAAHGRAQPVVRAIYDRLDFGKISHVFTRPGQALAGPDRSLNHHSQRPRRPSSGSRAPTTAAPASPRA